MIKVLAKTNIDRLAITVMLGLSLAIALLVIGGNACGNDCVLRTGPRVRDFSWQDRQIGAEDRALILTFNRPMERDRVEAHLEITPALPGKFSWAGRRMAYTLNEPAPYGTTYTLHLEGARERFGQDRLGKLMQPFTAQFRTRDRAFAYIGVEGEEQGRLVVYNLTQQRKLVLTPPELVVTDFEVYPKGDRIVFTALERGTWRQGIQEQRLYSVTTGGVRQASPSSPELKLILDNADYQILQFDLSPDGESIVVRLAHREDPADFDLWLIQDDLPPQPLATPPGGEFLIAPDGRTLALAQGEGIALLPLAPEGEPIDFLPDYGRLLSFSHDGSAAAMVNFNTDSPELRFVRSLYLVTNRGTTQKLLDTQGSFLNCQFNSTATRLYCLLTQLIHEQEYTEQPYLVAIDLATQSVKPLLKLPGYQDIQFSPAPDDLGLLFDQVIPAPELTMSDALRTNSGEAILSSRLWLLVPTSSDEARASSVELEELPLPGFRPRWLP